MRKAQYVHGSNSAGRYFFLFCGLIIRTLLIIMVFATIAVVCRIYPTIKLWLIEKCEEVNEYFREKHGSSCGNLKKVKIF